MASNHSFLLFSIEYFSSLYTEMRKPKKVVGMTGRLQMSSREEGPYLNRMLLVMVVVLMVFVVGVVGPQKGRGNRSKAPQPSKSLKEIPPELPSDLDVKTIKGLANGKFLY